MSRRARKSRAPRRPFRRWLIRSTVLVVGLAFIATLLPIAALRYIPPITTAFMIESRFADPATGKPCERIEYRWVPWNEIARTLPAAILVAEDQRFFEHRGFDTHALGNALEDYAQGERMRGASTLTQQVAKNLFLWPGRSLLRKALEAWFTIWIEVLWPKHRILEVHLNVAQFGPCVFGAEAASRRFFGIPASRLTPRQAAAMAVVLPSPGRMRVHPPSPFVEERVREVLAELRRPDGPPSYLNRL